ncbi:MAG: exosortase system-associated protein, TIGR04073 family [Candidatus Omnitrophota bacterium]
MRKKVLVFCFIISILLSFSKAFAIDAAEDSLGKEESGILIDTADMRYKKTPLNKLQRGLGNLGTCYFEIPASMFNVAAEEGDFLGFFLGSVQGLFTTLFRALDGVFDTATFFVPPYNKPIMQPEYAYQSLKQAYNNYDEKK